MRPTHLALVIPSLHVDRACSSHQLCRGFGQQSIVIVGTSASRTRGNEMSVPVLYIPCALAPAQSVIRSSRAFTKTSPRPGEGGFGDPFQADQRNASTSRSSSEEQKRKPLSGVCTLSEMKCQKSSAAPPTSTLSEKRVDGTFWAGPRPTRQPRNGRQTPPGVYSTKFSDME